MQQFPIAHNNLEEFADPANYDVEEATAAQLRGPYFCDLANRFGGPILELACGTGLITIPVAAYCNDVTGVDLCQPMLQHARGKATRCDARVNWHEADMRTLDLRRTFQLIFLTGNAFQALLTRQDQESLLQVVRRHLSVSGLFVFETRNPSGHALNDQETEEHWYAYKSVEGHSVQVTGTQTYDPILQLMHWTTFRRWTADSTVKERRTRITCRFTYPQELLALLAHSGFHIAWQHGDWEGGPLTSASGPIITACRRHPPSA